VAKAWTGSALESGLDLFVTGADDLPMDDAAAAPYLSSREAAETLIAAVERAGAPWEVLKGADLAGRDLTTGRRWPLVLPDGELLGVVVRNAGEPDPNDELIRVLLRTFASLVAAEESATEVTRRAVEAEQEARSDVLTGLPNRRAWDHAIDAESARMVRHGHAAVVLVIDLDGLKEVNDSEGHLAGDLLLRRTARAIEVVVREEDVVARIGGDEFAVLLVEADESSVDGLVSRLRTALLEADVDASIGAFAASPGTSLVDAFHEADRRMYEAKQQRKRLAAERH
jgi:diguanylate cyclase (GGDEF)-like protein